MGYIYRIDFPDNYFYIGSTKISLAKRLSDHKRNKLWSSMFDPHSKGRFNNYVKLYGWNNPTIYMIEECCDDDRLSKEYELISKLIDDPKNLNTICKGQSRRVISHVSSCNLEA